MHHGSEFYGFCIDFSLCLVNCCYLRYVVLMSIVYYMDVSTVIGKWLHLCKLTGVKSSSCVFGNWNKKSGIGLNHIYICTVLSGVSASALAQIVLTDASKVGTHVCNLGIDHILLPWSYCQVLSFWLLPPVLLSWRIPFFVETCRLQEWMLEMWISLVLVGMWHS